MKPSELKEYVKKKREEGGTTKGKIQIGKKGKLTTSKLEGTSTYKAVMMQFRNRTLKTGKKKDRIVKSKNQAVAIAAAKYNARKR